MLFKKLIFFKIWRIVKFFIQNLTRCFFIKLKTDALWNFQVKIGRVVKLSFQNLTC